MPPKIWLSLPIPVYSI
jgi:hypothetical protein